MFSASSIAHYFLEMAMNCDQSMSSAKLQALVYYAHGWHVGCTGRALINEKIQAGPYGLVIPSLYREYRRFGPRPIEGMSFESVALDAAQAAVSPHALATQTLLRAVFCSYASYSETQLCEMICATETPWDVTWRASKGMRGVNIPLSSIAAYFQAAVQNASL